MNAPQPIDYDDSIARLRVPPHQIEAEQSVLGSLLLDNAAWDRCGDLLSESDFYRAEHRFIFGAIGALIQASKPADVVTVFERLQGRMQESAAGGLVYLNQLAQCVPSAANVRRYAEIVRERAILRRLIAASDEIATDAFNPQGRGVVDLLGQAEARIMAIGRTGGSWAAAYQQMRGLTAAMLDRISDLAERGGSDLVGISTGFPRLDEATAGLQAGDLFVLAARPSMGKTALAMNIAEHVALKLALPVAVFSMEMSAAQLALRMAGSVGKIRGTALRTGRLIDEQWGRLSEAADLLARSQMMIDEAPGLRGVDVRSRARRMARDAGGKLGLIVIDYLQLMAGSGSDENRATELGEITRELKGMGKELDCPVLLLSQLNRSVESRHDKRPMMSDLRDSGAIEQDADVVAFIYRDDYYAKDASKEPGVAEIILAKQRSGPVCTVRLGWAGELTRFYTLAADYEPGRARQAGDQGFD